MTERKKIYFIVNPNSGKGAVRSKLGSILNILQLGGYEVTVHMTQRQLDATDAAKEACDRGEFDMLVCSGGDGTLNEVVNGVMQTETPLPIGYIPCGTMNDFAKNLGISKDMEEAANGIIQGVPFKSDVGNFNGRYFTYVACFGAFTDVSYATKQSFKNIFGNAAYILDTVRSTFGIRNVHLKVEYDGKEIENDFILCVISNSSSVAGIKMPGRISLNDGEFEVLLVRTPRNPLEFQSVLSRIIIQDTENEYIRYFKASHIKIKADADVPWCIDGEFGGNSNEVTIRNIPRAVQVIAPPEHFGLNASASE